MTEAVFFAYNWSGKHFNPTSCGVIRNQRSKIRRSYIISTAGCPFLKISKFECRVIKHARNYCNSFSSPNHIQVQNKRRAIKKIYQPCCQKNNFATVNCCNHENARHLTRTVVEQRKKAIFDVQHHLQFLLIN